MSLSKLELESGSSATKIPFLEQSFFYLKSQELLNKYYLQPFNKTSNGYNAIKTKHNIPKLVLKDGHIEREIHGAMHASRVSIYVEILHRIIQEQFPDYVNESIRTLETTFNLNEASILLLTRYVALCHDAAREGEGHDQWEKKSAEIAKHFLKENGIKDALAQALSLLINHKDNSPALDQALSQLGFSEVVKASFNYLRQLIGLSDCFDIIRCTGNFHFSYAQKQLDSIPDFNHAKHSAVFFEFAKQVYALLRDQHDLYFPTRLIGPNQEVYSLPPGENDFSLAEKVKFEHANNVPSAIISTMRDHLYFLKYLQNETEEVLANTQLSEVKAAFNPFIHGTSTQMLAILEKTDWKVQSPLDLLENYLRAPITGELSQGGLSQVSARCDTCFARLSGMPNSNEYALEEVIKNYAKKQVQPINREEALNELLHQLRNASRVLFSNINLILVFAARYRQLGGDLNSVQQLKNVFSKIDATNGIFYLYLILSQHLKVIDTFEKNDRLDLADAYYTHFKSYLLMQKIEEQKLDLAVIYHSPTPENLQKVLILLEVPKTSTIEKGVAAKLTVVTLKHTNAFQIKKSQDVHRDRQDEEDLPIGYLFGNTGGYEVQRIMDKLVNKREKLDLTLIKDELLEHIQQIESRTQLLKRMLQNPVDTLKYSKETENLIKNAFPLLLVYDQDKKIRIINMKSQEYRAEAPLILGKDIQIIATDNKEHQQQLQDYFSKKSLKVKVILFSDLFEARNQLFGVVEIENKTENNIVALSNVSQAGFFANKILSQSTLTLKELGAVQDLIINLQREINSCWPYPNKDRKKIKMAVLNELIENTNNHMPKSETIIRLIKDYPDAVRGSLSTRTAILLGSLS